MIDKDVLERTLGRALRNGGDFAEVFAEDRRTSAARLDDGKVEELVSGRERGAGVRVIRGETTGYAHTADLSEESLRDAAVAAAAAARVSDSGTRVVTLEWHATRRSHEVQVLPETIDKARKVQLLERADDAARAEELEQRAAALASAGDAQ